MSRAKLTLPFWLQGSSLLNTFPHLVCRTCRADLAGKVQEEIRELRMSGQDVTDTFEVVGLALLFETSCEEAAGNSGNSCQVSTRIRPLRGPDDVSP